MLIIDLGVYCNDSETMFKMTLAEKLPLKKNIVFFLIDGLRADQCHGENKSSKTPNIDLLIKNGISKDPFVFFLRGYRYATRFFRHSVN